MKEEDLIGVFWTNRNDTRMVIFATFSWTYFWTAGQNHRQTNDQPEDLSNRDGSRVGAGMLPPPPPTHTPIRGKGRLVKTHTYTYML